MSERQAQYGDDSQEKPSAEDDVLAFIERFDTWIMKQSEQVQLSTALAFGKEYADMRAWFEVPEEFTIEINPVCEWETTNDANGVPYWGWDTKCGHRVIEDPTDDDFNFVWTYCPYCGRRIKVTP